jgi:hypothetical protein
MAETSQSLILITSSFFQIPENMAANVSLASFRRNECTGIATAV